MARSHLPHKRPLRFLPLPPLRDHDPISNVPSTHKPGIILVPFHHRAFLTVGGAYSLVGEMIGTASVWTWSTQHKEPRPRS